MNLNDAFYAIEAMARRAPPDERLSRRTETTPPLAAFFECGDKVVTMLSVKSKLAEAFHDTVKRRDALWRFLTDARLEIDNNIPENAIRIARRPVLRHATRRRSPHRARCAVSRCRSWVAAARSPGG